MANAVQLTDEFGNPITADNPLPTGGGGSASAANQEIANARAGVQFRDTPDILSDGEYAAPLGDERGRVQIIIVNPETNLPAAIGGDLGQEPGTPFKSLDLDESEEQVAASPGKILYIHCMNMAATKRYLKLYDGLAADVTVGTTIPKHTFPLPTLGDTNGQGFCLAAPIAFLTALTVAATTGFADNDTGAPGANDVILNLGYKLDA